MELLLILMIMIFVPLIAFPIYFLVQWFRAGPGWQKAAADLGLQYQGGGWSERCITGTLNDFYVKVNTYSPEGQTSGTHSCAVVYGGSYIPSDLGLCGEGGWQAFKKLFTGEDIQIHDREFDDSVHVRGTELEVVALLSRATREAVLELVSFGGKVREGNVYFDEPGTIGDSRRIVDLVRCMVDVAGRLVIVPGEMPRALATNAMEDPNAHVRVRNTQILLDRFSGDAAAVVAARAALKDADPRMRLLGAQELGEEGFATLKQIAERDSMPSQLRVRALDHMAATFPGDRVAPTIEVALAAPDAAVRRAGVLAVGVTGKAGMLDRAYGLLAASPSRRWLSAGGL